VSHRNPETVSLRKEVRSLKHLERAWRVIEENGRYSKSESVKKEINAFQERANTSLRSISGRLCRDSFVFPPARGIPIPKQGRARSQSFRPIVLATVESRIVQRAILDALVTVPALKPYFVNPYSFGGIKKAGEGSLAAVPAAIQAVLDALGDGAQFVVCADINSFFTRISKTAVTRIIASAIDDPSFMTLFEQAIHVELANLAELREKASAFPTHDIGVAQGNALSPLLGNIILSDFDEAMNEGDCTCLRHSCPHAQRCAGSFEASENATRREGNDTFCRQDKC
jgi:RNA-directed DNA polymerase